MAITQKDLDGIENRLKDVFVTKEEFTVHKSELLNKLDEILKEILASRQEQTVLVHQVSGHEDRITTLEEKEGIATP